MKPFIVTKGVPFDYSFIYYQGVPTTGLAVDLTGASAQLTITDGTGGTTFLSVNSSQTKPNSGVYFGGQTNNPKSGIIELYISSTDTAAITWKYARYNLTLTTTLFGLQRLMYGSFAQDGFLP